MTHFIVTMKKHLFLETPEEVAEYIKDKYSKDLIPMHCYNFKIQVLNRDTGEEYEFEIARKNSFEVRNKKVIRYIETTIYKDDGE